MALAALAGETQPGPLRAELRRRRKRVRISTEFIAGLCRNTESIDRWAWWRIKSGIPQDARFVRADMSQAGHEVVLLFEHESFPEVNEGEMYADEVPYVETYNGVGDPPHLVAR